MNGCQKSNWLINRKIMNLEQALKRIEELEAENESLKTQLKKYENKSLGGRHKHDEKWQQKFEEWSALYEKGSSITEIMSSTGMSRRTFYRYKAYYDGIKQLIQNK